MIVGVPNLESRNAYLEQQRRPGLVIYVVITMILLAAHQRPFIIAVCSGAAWIVMNVAGTFGGLIWIWTIPDVMVASIIMAVGYALSRCGYFQCVVSPIDASFSVPRWFAYPLDNRNHHRGGYPHYLWIYRMFGALLLDESVPVQTSRIRSHDAVREVGKCRSRDVFEAR